MKTKECNYVVFESPGTLFSESSSKAINTWDIKKAIEMSKNISERYSAKPYGFYFETYLELDEDDAPLDFVSKKIKTSGLHYLSGKVETFDEITERDDDKEEILRSNMKCNNSWVLVTNTNSFKVKRFFHGDDVIINDDGEIIDKASNYKHYCDEMTEKWDKIWSLM